jgi:predicted nucleic-acid-binding Zn-ribbon protein
MDQILKYSCPKCGNKQYEIGEMWAYGSFWTKMLQLHARRFTFLSCLKCKYTEFYKVSKDKIGEVINTMGR